MHMQKLKLIPVFIVALSLAACEQGHEKQQAGTIIGAAAGALLGSQVGHGTGRTLAIIAGTAAGAWLGGKLGKSLDNRDRTAMQQTTQQSLTSSPTGTVSKWSNPDSGHNGTVTPQAAFTNKDGLKCREYQQTVTANGETETAYGTACQQKDGSWKVVSNG